jgi:hypothetical protein
LKREFITAHRKLVALGVTAVAAGTLAIGTMFTGAIFTDQQTNNATFTTGTVSLDPSKIAAMNLTTSGMMPGDSTYSSVEVKNTGSAQLRYSVSQTSTNADSKGLMNALNVTVKTADTGAGTDFATDGDYCDDGTGTTLHASAAMGASGNLVGDPTQGSQAGDRTLNSGASEVLCVYVSLPLSTGNAYQAASTTTTFSFDAEQTANN